MKRFILLLLVGSLLLAGCNNERTLDASLKTEESFLSLTCTFVEYFPIFV